MNEQTRQVLSALALPGVGRRTVVKASDHVRRTGDASNLLALCESCSASIREKSRQTAEFQMSAAESFGVRVLTYLDDDYPERLRTVDDPPACLFVKGNLQALHSLDAVAVIGTREPSSFAVKTAKSAAKFLASQGAVIVSGLAKGCDTLAHQGCLEAKGQTVAVLAHGLDKVYPAENRNLAEQIVKEEGALVSEYPIGAPPQRNSFVERDRLQSGLSDSVLVVETSETGGTMHTARFASKHHRMLATVEHPESYATDPRVGGNRQAERDLGAVPVKTQEELRLLMLSLRLAKCLEELFDKESTQKWEQIQAKLEQHNASPFALDVIRRLRNVLVHPNLGLYRDVLPKIAGLEILDRPDNLAEIVRLMTEKLSELPRAQTDSTRLRQDALF